MSKDNHEFIPNIKDVNNDELIRLANLLKSESYSTTLTNLATWQEKNISYFIERKYFGTFFRYLIGITFISLLFVHFDWWILVFEFTMGGTTIFLIYSFLRFIDLKKEIPELKFCDIMKKSLTADQILKYRLAVCRDYAKLTMAWFLYLFPESKYKKFFITIQSHVVAAIKVDENVFVIDKGLPITPLMNWMILWKEKKGKKLLKADKIEVKFVNNQIKTNIDESKIISQDILSNINTDKITQELKHILNITTIQNQIQTEFTFRLRLFALQYDTNIITHFSILEKLRMKIEDEFYHVLHRISNIEIIQDEMDIILKVFLSHNII